MTPKETLDKVLEMVCKHNTTDGLGILISATIGYMQVMQERSKDKEHTKRYLIDLFNNELNERL